MIVWAVLLLAAGIAVALCHLVVIGVVLFFFPAVAVHASVLQVTAVAVRFCLLLCAPEPTLLLCRIVIHVRLAPVVLPIVSILALVPLVTPHFIVEWAPDRLEVEHVKVRILLHLVQQVDRELLFEMGEGTQVAEVTRVYIVRPFVAELRFVLLRMVEGLDSVVRFVARLAIWAVARLCKLAHFAAVSAKGSSLILVVVVEALFLVVAVFLGARLCLEYSEVKQLHTLFVGRAGGEGSRAIGGRCFTQ